MKTYIGDSVYAEFDGYSIVLTTENGLSTDPSNRIILEPDVLYGIVNFYELAIKFRESVGQDRPSRKRFFKMIEFCQYCNEPICEEERADTLSPFHVECLMRSVIGSLAHLKHTCSCYVPGSIEGDPDSLTRREAAIVACEYWKMMNGRP